MIITNLGKRAQYKFEGVVTKITRSTELGNTITELSKCSRDLAEDNCAKANNPVCYKKITPDDISTLIKKLKNERSKFDEENSSNSDTMARIADLHEHIKTVINILNQTRKTVSFRHESIESYFKLISTYRKQTQLIRELYPEINEVIDKIVTHVIGLNIKADSYRSASLMELDDEITNLNEISVTADNAPHREQFKQSLRDLYSKAIEDIAMQENGIKTRNDHVATTVKNTVTMLKNLQLKPSNQEKLDEILKYKQTCAKQAPLIKNFFQAIMAVTYAGLLFVGTLGLLSCTRRPPLQRGKSLFNIPPEESIYKRLFFRPTGKVKPAADDVAAMAKKFINPPQSSSCGFFIISNETKGSAGELYAAQTAKAI